MAKLKRWNWTEANRMVNTGTRKRLLMAAELIKAEVRTKLKGQIGKGKTTGISRPVYTRRRFRGKLVPTSSVAWTQRNFGELLKSVRVVEKKEAWGFEINKSRNIRVYAGHYLAYYAQIFEFTRPFMRPAWRAVLPKLKKVF